MKNCAFFLLIALLFAACGDDGMGKDDNGTPTFTYEPIGWTMQLPKDWQVLSKAERNQLDYAAENYYEEAAGKKKGGEKKIIMGVRKGESNMNACYAFIRSYARDEDYPALRDLLRQQKQQYSNGTYQAQDTLITLKLGEHDFEKAILTVNYNGKPYFTYITYSTMLDTLNFGISIVTNNRTDEIMLDENFKRSVTSITTRQ